MLDSSATQVVLYKSSLLEKLMVYRKYIWFRGQRALTKAGVISESQVR